MNRKITRRLLEWKNSVNRQPLIIHGARQIGKTYSIVSFGKNEYTNCVYFNFEDSMNLQKIFEGDFDIERIIKNLTAMAGEKINKGSTLIIFDEIQTCTPRLNKFKIFL